MIENCLSHLTKLSIKIVLFDFIILFIKIDMLSVSGYSAMSKNDMGPGLYLISSNFFNILRSNTLIIPFNYSIIISIFNVISRFPFIPSQKEQKKNSDLARSRSKSKLCILIWIGHKVDELKWILFGALSWIY